MAPTRPTLARARSVLAGADVDSPDTDAAVLMAYVLGVERTRLFLIDEITDEQEHMYADLVARRARREPLQHLTGVAHFRYVDLAVGPGVFVPRPETELLAGWAIEQLADEQAPIVVDLCTGSGAIARSIADEVPHARVYAVELDEQAYGWAQRNLEGTGVDLRQGDFAEAFRDLDGTVDVVVCNPPYIPLTAWESVAQEARDHDPELALFSGQDGLDAIRVLEQRAAQLLKNGGVLGFEHADEQGPNAENGGAPAVLTATGRWADVRDHDDLAGRPRFTTGRLAT
ncbi:MAG: peptide chain release factor N(5)-glutamine methyltransferase [Nocardioides sp.]|nr:peptide chain release factor N(5)-glutamine methyltransferase [Nocardioides sp.]